MVSENRSEEAVEFASRLKAAMVKRVMSQRQLAAAVGVSKQSVTNWTQGRNEPGLAQVRRLAEALQVSVAYLVGEGDVSAGFDMRAEDLLGEFAELGLKEPVESLSRLRPNLLDLLAEAEAMTRPRRRESAGSRSGEQT